MELGWRTIEQVRDQYRRDLFDDFLPFMDRFVVDHELGGFLCNADRDGERITANKDSWYDGRGIWVYSFLHNALDGKPEYLGLARKTAEFVLSIRPRGDDPRWPRRYTREGIVLAEDREIYGSLFIAEGLAELARAAGEPGYRHLAKEITLACARVYDRADYSINVQHYLGAGAAEFPGARVLGTWMVLLRIATQMLRAAPDAELEGLAERSVDAIMNFHHVAELDLSVEFLDHDLARPSGEYARFVYSSHAIETFWMVMDEALRRGDEQLFLLAAERFRRHLEVSWDHEFGGVFPGVRDVERNDWLTDKFLWAQEEVLVGALLAYEHTGADWARDIFSRMYEYVQATFPLARHGLPLWITFADRKGAFTRHFHRIENYHHPRHLMLNLLSLDRLLERGPRNGSQSNKKNSTASASPAST